MSYTYAVRCGRQTGLFSSWIETEKQVTGFSGAEHKKFLSKEEAQRWLDLKRQPINTDEEVIEPPRKKHCPETPRTVKTIVYCDGSCLGNGTNKARGGIGVWFGHDNERNLSEPLAIEVDRPHTNQKAELWAAIRTLQELGVNEPALIWTDSDYALKSATLWRHRWISRQWQVQLTNLSLHRQLSDLMDQHPLVEWRHVYGHKGVEGNEAADRLAKEAVQ